ncbi:MAG TPA: AAA family ATPase [Rubrobacteraceae bacterium]|nr:AAA family ATPase [Rubrobacteraceae bacterium]
MSSGGWREASQEYSCPICGKPDWCSVSDDDVWAICRRKDNGTGEHKVDASGADYWLYRLKEPPVESVSQEDPPEVPERVEPETLDQVYGALLDELSLRHAHRQDLQRRGLSERQIKRRGYRTLPSGDREGCAGKLVEHFGPEVCSKVPGLYEKEGGPARWSIAGAAGVLIPVRDAQERIVAIKVRADDPGEGPKYSYLSSSKHGGSGPGSQVHVPLSEDPGRGPAVRLTEGELKADVATALSGMLSVSVPGVSSWRNALPVLKALGFDKVHLAFDTDARRNRNVARALSDAFRALDEQGFEVVLETWPEGNGKGIDDLLAAGHQPDLKLGDEARKAVNEILAEANGLSLVLNNAFTAEELMAKVFPEPKWIVPGVLPEGATILAGSPKTGKSWMALGIGVAVASGGTALGGKPVEPGSVLYLALEDNPRRLQGRLSKVLAGEKPPHGLVLTDRWPRLGEGGLEAMEAWLISHPDARLVIVDTLEKIRSKGSGRNVYREDYEAVAPLLSLAAQYNVAVLVVHHLRKGSADDPLDEVSGSHGLTGGVDGVLVLKRERGRADAFLFVTGRDIEQERELALSWDPATASWKIAGDAEEYRGSKERAKIVECVRSAQGPMGPKEASDALGKDYNATKQLMWKMSNDGDLRSVGSGKYVVTGNFDNRDNRGEEESATEGAPESPAPASGERFNPEDDAPAQKVNAVIEVTDDERVTVDPTVPIPLITSQEQLDSAITGIRQARMLALDLETTGLSPRNDRVRLISLATAQDTWLVDCFEVDPRPLFGVLAQKTLVIHNALFDLGFLLEMGFELGEGGEVIDTMLMSQILEDKDTEEWQEAV